MARVGLVGGLGPESTIDYYRRILAVWAEKRPGDSPELMIDSLDVQTGLRLAQHDHAGLTRYLADSVARLASAGCDLVAMTANTAHLVFDEVAAVSPVPMLSIVETCADEAARRGLRRMVLLGTRFTMEGPFYPRVFSRRGMELVTLPEAERLWVHERYVGELLKGDFRPETRTGVAARVQALAAETRADGVILGGTELPLLLGAGPVSGLPALDTTELHVRAIVDTMLRNA